MDLKDFYRSAQVELVEKRKTVSKVLKQNKLLGEYLEAIFRDFVKSILPKRYEVARGVIIGKNKTSRECDIIIYNAHNFPPLFKSGEIVLIESYVVSYIIEVKTVLNTTTVREALVHFKNIKEIEPAIKYFLVGFETSHSISYLKEKCKEFDGVFVFSKKKGQTLEIKPEVNNQLYDFCRIFRGYNLGQKESQELEREL
jgi:hypothetical protein